MTSALPLPPFVDLHNHLVPGVDDGVCFFPDDVTANASDDTHPSRRLAALYVSSTLAPQEVLNALRTRIDPVFLPRPIFRVTQLPRNANGKIRAAALADLHVRCKAEGLAESLLPAPDVVQHCAVPVAHPSLPGHFPGDPIVPGVIILARVAEAIRSRFPHIELGALLNVRFHSPLRPGESFCVRPQLHAGLVRFEVQLAAPSIESQPDSGTVIASGRWAFSAPVCGKPYRK